MFDTIYRHLTSLTTPNTSSLFIHDYFVVFDTNITSRLIKRMAISRHHVCWQGNTRYVGDVDCPDPDVHRPLHKLYVYCKTLFYFLYFRKV
jgi:hypothetical protein